MPRWKCRVVVALAVAVLLPTSGCTEASPRTHVPAPAFSAAGPTSFDVRTENALPGDRWGASASAAPGELSGWFDEVSALPGDRLRLFVSSTDRTWTASAFRFGWYGGVEGRRVWSSAPQPGVRQPPPRTLAPTSTVTAASWRPSLTIDTTGWPPGDYLVRLDGTAGRSTFVPVTLRGPTARGKVVLLNAVTTWQAYNHWGGYSLYAGPDRAYGDRARAVSFDRPYDFGDGAADFLGNERPLLALAERLGLPLDYATDVDVEKDPHLLDGAVAVLSAGHDEYWSPAMRQRLTAARDHGTSIGFFGANAVYRRIRLTRSAIGADRIEVNYKVGAEDPIVHTDPAASTGNWPDPPAAVPESTLTGESYRCNPVHADLVFTGHASWLLTGSGAKAGTRVPGLVGSEYDGLATSGPHAGPHPTPIDAVASSPVTCRGATDVANATWYSTPSGAGVFDAGTSAWVCALDNVCAPGTGGGATQHVISAVTTNLLLAMAGGSAGRMHPATGTGQPSG